MMTEHYLFRDSLEPTEAEWAIYKKQVLGARNECPPLTALHAFAMDRCGNAQEVESIGRHCLGCGYCRACVTGFRKGGRGKEPGSAPAAGSWMNELAEPSPRPTPQVVGGGPAPAEEPGTVVETIGMADTVAPGDAVLFTEAATHLAAYVPHILLEVGHSRDLAKPLVEFLKAQPGLRVPIPSSTLLRLLEEFVRKANGTALELRPDQTAEAILARAAVRRLLEEEKRAVVRDFLQAALDRGRTDPQLLALLRDEDVAFHGIEFEEIREMMNRVVTVLTWLQFDTPAALPVALIDARG